MNGVELISAGVLASLILQGGKYVYRRWVVKDMEYKFHEAVYFVLVPVLAFFVTPALAWLGVSGYEMPVDWVVWVKQGLVTALTMLGAYFVGVDPLKEYRKQQLEKRNGNS